MTKKVAKGVFLKQLRSFVPYNVYMALLKEEYDDIPEEWVEKVQDSDGNFFDIDVDDIDFENDFNCDVSNAEIDAVHQAAQAKKEMKSENRAYTMENYEKRGARIKFLEQQLKDVQEDNDDLTDKCDELQAKCDELQAKCDELQSTIDSLNAVPYSGGTLPGWSAPTAPVIPTAPTAPIASAAPARIYSTELVLHGTNGETGRETTYALYDGDTMVSEHDAYIGVSRYGVDPKKYEYHYLNIMGSDITKGKKITKEFK